MLMMMPWAPHFPAVAGGGGGDATITCTASDAQVAPSTSYSFTSQSFGSADATRQMICGVVTERTGASPATVSAMTIGGVSASLAQAVSNGSETAELWVAAVPTGTSGTVAITFAASAAAVGIGLWAVITGSGTKTDSGSDSDSNPATFDLDIAAGGVAVAIVNHRSNVDATFTWLNVSDSAGSGFDQVVDPGDIAMSGASAAFASLQTNLTISATSSQAGVRSPVMVTASFPKL